jgi:dnd system-associated protein 4
MRSIYRNKEHGDIIQRLTERNPETNVAVFPTIKALQCFAAVLGYENGRRVKLDRSNVENIEWHTFENTRHTHFIYLIALAETNDFNVLKFDVSGNADNQSEEHMIEIFEEYANGGFELIRSWLNKNPGDPYGDKAILVAMEKAGFLKSNVSEFDDVEF